MCGLAGFLTTEKCEGGEAAPALLRCVADTIVSRGPHDSGVWCDPEVGVGLAHRRLSIFDLSPAGYQPMFSASGRYVIVFNSEIYNHLELRAALEKISAGGTAPSIWRGHSNTETLLAGFEVWEVEATLQKAVGIWAFALWDRETRTLTLARDRMGEKPLYYGWVRGALVLASELQAIHAFPGFDNVIERRALALFMRHNYVPAPYSTHKGIFKLPTGAYVTLAASDATGASPWLTHYWQAFEVACQPMHDDFDERHQSVRNGPSTCPGGATGPITSGMC